jgi:hypothetical protein
VGSHVAMSHLDMEQLALGRPPAVIIMGAAFLIALGARLAADASNTYYVHLGWAALRVDCGLGGLAGLFSVRRCFVPEFAIGLPHAPTVRHLALN